MNPKIHRFTVNGKSITLTVYDLGQSLDAQLEMGGGILTKSELAVVYAKLEPLLDQFFNKPTILKTPAGAVVISTDHQSYKILALGDAAAACLSNEPKI